jgi:uncharacterized membrane protein YhaH (DUF805 family)
MQQPPSAGGARLSANSATNTLLNGLIPSQHISKTKGNNSSLTPSQTRVLPNSNNPLKRSERIKYILLVLLLTIIFALLLITTIELGTRIVKHKKEEDLNNVFINSTSILNQTKFNEENTSLIRSFFACVWFFNVTLFFICLFLHLFLYQHSHQHDRARAAFLRYLQRFL